MKELIVEYQLLDSWKELSASDQLLVEKAYEVSDDAYAPYSKFKVGASVLLDNGEIIVGSNQENIAFPSGLCAERVALFHCGAVHPKQQVVKIVIVAKGDLVPMDKILAPCGACRQVMLETEARQKTPYQVILVSQNNQTLMFNSASDLLPFAF